MVCRHPNCINKGAICCRCQLKYHCDNGHTLESFVPLDEVLILCQTQNPKAEYFEDLSVDGMLEVQQLQSTLSNINNSIQEQLKRELLILGQYQKPFKDIYGIISHYSQIDGDTSRTDDGTQGGMKSDFMAIMQYIADRIIVVDGEFAIDQSDMNNCLTQIIERKRKNLSILQKLNKKSQKQARIISALFQTGCSFGLDQHIPISQFNQWVQLLRHCIIGDPSEQFNNGWHLEREILGVLCNRPIQGSFQRESQFLFKIKVDFKLGQFWM
ncbi:unnamed protein product (macronuclear) [Paramecium tetraurelia]|uniref:Uncharacterized protein n=1 Tax=Paramecium tetraurelia TaxID=5888 RepID=A0CCF2_PARTE|nr:uncharacterized protein GSPATT00037254001 [Paramecium tetraurelia]CAK68469.1 unnamed protein product [Paramecium tetraurelia]|eukprot:XP_001435866.1 hypothetical protein (macronuclear) [Paramecium tetraurelia strain d4-2]